MDKSFTKMYSHKELIKKGLQSKLTVNPWYFWYARQDSNLRPTDSKSGALSSWATGAEFKPCKTSPFAQFLRQTQILILEILNVYLRLKSSSSLNLSKIGHFPRLKWQRIWGEWRDLNPRPPGPQPGALPTELHPPYKLKVPKVI